MKKVLILSDGPFPTPEHDRVEGGGLRCWGLAKGLLANSKDGELSITAAYNIGHKKEPFTDEYEGVQITTWNMEELPRLIAEADSILVSYCMGDLSTRVAELVSPIQQLILDCYVPIYVEMSARDSANVEKEFEDYRLELEKWSHVLKRGDLFLVASDAQKSYYQGVISAVGRINPVSYGDDPIIVAPYGIYREEAKAHGTPISDMTGDKKTKKILWFGGIYPWFDLRGLIEATALLNEQIPSKLVIVGAKNPFNRHPDFIRRYEELESFANEARFKGLVEIEGWAKFTERADWYLDADIVVVVNREGLENHLAWRTRMIDFMWADLPVITNGGDPLSEEMIKGGAALRFSGLEPKEIAHDLKKALDSPASLEKIKKQMGNLKKDYYWDVSTKELAGRIVAGYRAKDLSDDGVYEWRPDHPRGKSRFAKLIERGRQMPEYRRRYGARATWLAVRTLFVNKLDKRRGPGSAPRLVVVSHQLNYSGAPYVLLDLLAAIREAGITTPIDFRTFLPVDKSIIGDLNRLGIRPKIYPQKNRGFTFAPGDTLLLNTVSHSFMLKDSAFRAAETGNLKKIIWYVHEDQPELLFTAVEKARIRKLLLSKKLVIFTLAHRCWENYKKFFETEEGIFVEPYRFSLPEGNRKKRDAKDFETAKFILPGTINDARKGQPPVFYAFIDFFQTYYSKNPGHYRDFELTFVGAGNDFLSRQFEDHAPGLDSHFRLLPTVSRDESLRLIMESNLTICYSLREALPLFVYEGMLAGHPLLRNDCSGMEEQLEPGKNGWLLESKDYRSLIETIETVLNKKKTPNAALAAMSAESYRIAMEQSKNDYASLIAQL